MHVPIDRSPLHRHTELHSNDAVSVAALLRSKDFELLLPRRAETDGPRGSTRSICRIFTSAMSAMVRKRS